MKSLSTRFKTGRLINFAERRQFFGQFLDFEFTFHRRVTQIQQYSWDNAQVILVGNKCDMEDERVVSTERGRQLAEQLKLHFFESSAKDNINVKVVFETLVDIICEKMSQNLDSDPNMPGAGKGQKLTDHSHNNPQSNNCQC